MCTYTVANPEVIRELGNVQLLQNDQNYCRYNDQRGITVILNFVNM